MERLTNEQLTEIRKRAEAQGEWRYDGFIEKIVDEDVPNLLAEVERLNALVRELTDYIIREEARK